MAHESDSSATEELLQQYLDTLPLPDRELSSAQVEFGQQARQRLVALGGGAVPALLDALASPEFVTKDAAYDLLVELGAPARKALHEAWGARDPVVDIWIATVLRYLGDPDALDRLWPLLSFPDSRVRHLGALALAFQLEDPAENAATLVPVLQDALEDTGRIEGTPFTIAGSALAMLSRLAEQSFTSPPKDIYLYNYDGFIYPPPLHPFPFAADLITHVEGIEQRRIRERVRNWWKRTGVE
jgi:hypothetical protein